MSVNVFCHLKVHTDFTLARASSSVKDYIKRAHDISIPAFAVTDTENMFDVLNFSNYARSAGIQPIMACQFNFMDGDRKNLGQFQLYAMNEQGYINLCRLVRLSHEPYNSIKGMVSPETPLVSNKMLKENNEGLICLTGGGDNGLMYNLHPRYTRYAEEIIESMHKIFGNRLYIEICRNGQVTKKDAATEDFLIAQADKHNIPLVATSDIWYASEERHDAWLLIRAVSDKDVVMVKDTDNEKNEDFLIDADEFISEETRRFHMRTPDEMFEMFKDLPEAFQNTKFIALRCHVNAPKRAPILPPFECGDGKTESEELTLQATNGLKERIAHIREYRQLHGMPEFTDDEEKKYYARLDRELKTINNMGFPGYFLIVSDFIIWSKKNDVPVGPGRGSGAGSIVAWSLKITDIDPMEYGLLFERFLNEKRVSMPDFDVDFCIDGRERVIEYVKQKYGADKVAMISAFGKVKSKTALSDIQRILIHESDGKMGFNDVKLMTRLVPNKSQGNPHTLKDIYSKDENGEYTIVEGMDFRDTVKTDIQKMVVRNALKIEGLHRSKSAHPAGIVIGDRPIDELVPVAWDDKFNMPVANFDGKGVETSGLVKFDFLGLKNLSVINLAVKYINARNNNGTPVDISKIDMKDADVYKEFAKGNSIAVFQFESRGMQEVLRQMKVTQFEDLIAAVSLYRPGPMAFIPEYARCKNGQQKPDYPEPVNKTKPFLEETYGIMVYQEQVMQVVQACAGYSLGDADILRRAMGKKIMSEMEKQKEIFIHGSHNDPNHIITGAVNMTDDNGKPLGVTEKQANELFDKILDFANYGFNKSHAAAYALISYQTMWLKVHYPLEYMAATLTYLKSNDKEKDKNKIMISELKRMGIRLLPPDVNHSHINFVPEYGNTPGIRFGIHGINGFSDNAYDFSDEREKNGPYLNIFDFYERVGRNFNKNQLANLAMTGALDSLMPKVNRRWIHDSLLAMNKSKTAKGQHDLTDKVPLPSTVTDWTSYAIMEKQGVGYYFMDHPADENKEFLSKYGFRRLATWVKYLHDIGQAEQYGVRFCGIIVDAFYKRTQSGRGMISLRIEDGEGIHRAVMFASDRKENDINDEEMKLLYTNLQGARENGLPMLFEGKMALRDDGDPNLIVYKIQDMDAFRVSMVNKIEISPTIEKMASNLVYGMKDKNNPEFIALRKAYHAICNESKGKDEETWRLNAKKILGDYYGEIVNSYGEALKSSINKHDYIKMNKHGYTVSVRMGNDEIQDIDIKLDWNPQVESFFISSGIPVKESYRKPI